MSATLHQGDCLAVLKTLPAESVHCIVTSPPYLNLRDYGHAGQVGLERSLAEYRQRLVEIFHEARRVLRLDGTCWLNLGDSYCTGAAHGYKKKDLFGVPWEIAFALRTDGWFLRSEVIWQKSNCLPESVADRPTKSHETIFMLTRSARYYYNADAIREPVRPTTVQRYKRRGLEADPQPDDQRVSRMSATTEADAERIITRGRNKRSVWTCAAANFRGSHYATYPPALITPCILAGSPPGGVVMDPFSGTGTTGEVALKHGRKYVGIELNPEYLELARKRLGLE